jgi:hypothetical protein
LLEIIIWIESLSDCSELLGVNVHVVVISEAEVVLKLFSVTSCFEANHPDSLAKVNSI